MNDTEQAIQNYLLDVQTALPGVIVSYSGGRAVVKPTIAKQLTSSEELPAPQIFEVPVVMPSGMGGSAKVSVPLQAGDPVLLIFSSRGLDDWKEGKTGAPKTARSFDLNDAFAIPFGGHTGGYDAQNVSMQYGGASIKITAGGEILIKANSIKVEAPNTDWQGLMAMSGAISVSPGNGGSGSAKFGGDVKAGGGAVGLLTHVHDCPHGGKTSTGRG